MDKKGENKQDSDEKPALIRWFSELDKDSGLVAGGKGANLGEIYNLRIPVPPGFVVTAQAYDYFIEYSGLKNQIKGLLDKINYQDTRLLNDITEVIRNHIIEAKMPKEMEEEIIEAYENLGASDLSEVYGSALDILHNAQEPIFVAVRSSPTTGDLAEKNESFLNVKGNLQLIDHIKRCFASLFTSKSTYYRNEQNLNDAPINLAVVVQKMVDSTKSGVIFSKDPNYKDKNIVIESIWGLGEGITSGTINFDKYIINHELEIMDIQVAEKEIAITRDSSGNRTTIKLREEKSKQQVLTKNEILKLSELALKIEEHYKKPQCIEFAIEGGDIYIVQTRSIKITEKDINTENAKNENLTEEILIADLPTKSKDEEESSEEVYKKIENIYSDEIKKVIAKTKTKIKLLVDLPSFAERASKTGLKSVGLTRMEDIIAESGKHPNYYLSKGDIKDYEEVIFKGVNDIAKYFDELWVRTSDIRTDEFSDLEGAPKEKEANPMLGSHGIRFSLKNPKILEAELNALKRVSESGKEIGIILPQVILVEEVQKVKKILNEINFKNAKLGVMVETPAAVQIINQLCDEGIAFISFGTNNLTQYMLAVDRGNDEVQDLYNEMHPAILYQLAYVIRVCKRKGIQSSICGQAGSKKEMVKFLVENGIDSISVNADVAAEIADYVKEIEENLVKGTDKEPRKYNPKEDTDEEPVHIKGIEKLH